jgi:hypothetical protein
MAVCWEARGAVDLVVRASRPFLMSAKLGTRTGGNLDARLLGARVTSERKPGRSNNARPIDESLQ